MKNIPLLLSTMAVAYSGLSHADTTTDQQPAVDETITVTANRVPSPAVNSAQILIIDRVAIERSGSNSLADLLFSKAGFQFSRAGGDLHQTNLYIRGLDSKQMVFLVNGQRVGSATLGITEFQLIPLAQIERIEIVKGTRSAIYGADAQAGVINIITHKEGSGSSVTATVGSNQIRGLGLGTSLQKDKLAAYLNLSHDQSAGYDLEQDATNDADGYRRNALNTGVSYQVSAQATIGLDIQANQGLSEFDNPWSSSNQSDFDNHAYSANYDFNGNNLNLRAQLGRSYDQSWTYGGTTSPSNGADFYKTRQDSAEVTGIKAITKEHAVILGADANTIKLDTSLVEYTQNSRKNQGALLGYRYTNDLISLETGARYDDNSAYGDFWSFNHSISFDFASLGVISAGQATGFKAPTFNDLYYPGFSNPELAPEISRIWNLDYQLEFILNDQVGGLEISGQRALFNNQIVFSNQTFVPENIGRSAVNFASISWTQDWSNSLTTELTQEWSEGKNLETNEALVRRPIRSTKANLYWQYSESWQASLEGQHRGQAKDIYFDPNTFTSSIVTLSDYTLINLAVNYQASKALDLGVKIENLTNRDYQTIAGYPAQGRFAQITGRYNF